MSIRGLLCYNCNRFLGWLEKLGSPATAYLNKWEEVRPDATREHHD